MNLIYTLSAVILFASLLLLSCGYKSNVSASDLDTELLVSQDAEPLAAPDPESEPMEREWVYEPESLDNTIGVVTFTEDTVWANVKLLNDDGSIWLEYHSYLDEENPEKEAKFFDRCNEYDFYPRFVKHDYGRLVLACISEEKDSYIVEVNKKTKETKRLLKDKGLEFQTWEKHIVSQGFINLDARNIVIELGQNGKLYDRPANFADDIYTGLRVKEDNWLLLKSINQDDGPQLMVLWRSEDNKLLIDIFYLL